MGVNLWVLFKMSLSEIILRNSLLILKIKCGSDIYRAFWVINYKLSKSNVGLIFTRLSELLTIIWLNQCGAHIYKAPWVINNNLIQSNVGLIFTRLSEISTKIWLNQMWVSNLQGFLSLIFDSTFKISVVMVLLVQS